MTRRQTKRALAVACALCALAYGAMRREKPSVREETTVTETDTSVVENTVTRSTDSDGRVVYTNTRRVREKPGPRPKGLEIPARLTDRDEEIVAHEGFTLSYNRRRLLPNWVAWVLTRRRVRGAERRLDDFQPDGSVRRGPVALDSDYRGSGYDRGHMCPSADCKHSRQAQRDCFLLTNVCPQDHTLNAGPWRELEESARRWAGRYDSVYVVCGPVLEKGRTYRRIGEGGVTVPEQFFKVVMRLTPDGGAEAAGFLYDNRPGAQPMEERAVTVDSVERRTGIDFFPGLPKRMERRAEARLDLGEWR